MIIDTHTHFYDPTRPGGVPWPDPKDEFLYRRIMPEDYKTQAQPHGVTGTVVVEASSWVEDNQWILDLAENDPFLVGLVGHLNPQDGNFERYFNRFADHPLFLGIRLGRYIPSDATHRAALDQLMARCLTLDTHIGADFLKETSDGLSDYPDLRVALNHVALAPITGQRPDPEWIDGIRTIAKHPGVFCKVSGMVELSTVRPAPSDLRFYEPTLDILWDVFGEDRLIYGSNWPVSWRFAAYAQVHGLATAYFERKGGRVFDKVMGENSRTVYRWKKR